MVLYTRVSSTQKKLPVNQKKLPDGTSKPSTSSYYTAQLKRQEEVNATYSQLKKKHEASGKFKSEQLHTRAHMIF